MLSNQLYCINIVYTYNYDKRIPFLFLFIRYFLLGGLRNGIKNL